MMVDRYLVLPNPFPMGGANGSGPGVILTLAPFSGAGLIIHYTVFVSDGTRANTATETGACALSTVADTEGWRATLSNEDSLQAGELPQFTNCTTDSEGPFEVGIAVTDSLSFTPTIHNVYYQIENTSGSPISLIANSEALRSGVHTTPKNRTVRITREGLPASH